MRKKVLYVLLFLISIGFIQSQTLPLFKSAPFPQSQCNNLAGNYAAEWRPSHGSPNVLNLGCGNNVVRLFAKNESITERKSEGVFLDINMFGGTIDPTKKYKVIVSYRFSLPDNNYQNAVNFDVYFANDMVEKSDNNCSEEKMPTVSDKLKILTFEQGEFLSDTYPCQVKSLEKGQIAPTKSYKYIWITSNLNNFTPNLRGYVDIEKVEIYLDGTNPGPSPSSKVTLSPSDVSIPCGSVDPITFTANIEPAAPNAKYIWSAGSGWSKNGQPFTNETTSSNTITLTPTSPNVLPSSVQLKVTIGNNNYFKTSYITQPKIDPHNLLTISGSSNICNISESAIYNVNLENGQSVTWSSSDNSIAEIQSLHSPSTAVILKTQGVVTLTAQVSDPCGQQKTLTKSISVGTPLVYIPNASCGNPYDSVCFNYSYSMPIGSYSPLSIEAIGLDGSSNPATDFEWEKTNGPFTFVSNGGGYISNVSNNGTKVTGKMAILYVNSSYSNIQLRARAKNNCGWGPWKNIIFQNMGGYYKTEINTQHYQVSPNPASEFITISKTNEKTMGKATLNTYAELFNSLGRKVGTVSLNNDKGVLSTNGLGQGMYTLKIYTGNTSEDHQVIIK